MSLLLFAKKKFNPRAWFAAGEQGAWYDPSDFQPNWRRNLLTWSEDFSNAVWSKAGVTITSNSIIGPNNVLDASTITRTTTGANEAMVRFASAQIANTVYTVSIYVKLGTIGTSLYLRNLAIDAGNVTGLVKFNLTTGTVDLTFGATYAGKTSIVSVGNDWYRCSIIGTTSSTIANNLVDIGVTSSATIGGSANDYLYIDYAQLEQSSSASTYQKITDGIQDYYTVQPQPVLYQDSAGTTPVTAVEQPVGLMLDKSKGLALGAELFSSFTTTGNWAVSGANYSIVSAVSATDLNVTFAGTAGKRYIISFSANNVSGSVIIYPLESTPFVVVNGSNNIRQLSNANYFIIRASAGASASISNISVREIAGNHAFQATTVNKPLLSARVNLLTYTEDFSNAVWASTASNITVLSNNTTAPNGTLTADKIVGTLGTVSPHYVGYGGGNLTGLVIGVVYRASIYIKAGGITTATINFYTTLANVDLTAVTISGVGSTIDPVGDGWYKCTMLHTATATSEYFVLQSGATYTGDGTSGIYIWGADLRPTNAGALLPPYQRVTTASDYDTIGFPLYLACNGTVSSRSMSTNSIDFTATDKMTVVTGVRKLSDAANANVFEMGNTLPAGGFNLYAPNTVSSPSYSSYANAGTVSLINSSSSYPAPIANVISMLLNTSAASPNQQLLRVNSIASGTQSATLSGSFANIPLYLFSRAGTSSFLNGNFYGAIIRGAASDTASVTQTENYMATKTGINF